MSRTVYRNASGLPDIEQVTTARDQVLLGRAIQDRFPRFYRYFSVASFSYRGRAMRNHNQLLGRVEGVDGIKTGYTHASGFNLVTSVKRDGRHIVAAVFGGRSGRSRDARMRELIEQNIAAAATHRSVAKIVDPVVPNEATKLVEEASAATAYAPREHLAAVTPMLPSAGSLEPIQPRRVRTLSVKPNTGNAAALLGSAPTSITPPAHKTVIEQGSSTFDPLKPSATTTPAPSAAHSREEASPSRVAALTAEIAPARPVTRRGGWLIQVGAFADEGEAKLRLKSVMGAAKGMLNAADPFTERVIKGDKTLYRARFAGFDKNRAEAACRQLKRSDFACLALKN
jgi:D-alanyl-D-alanine carboxypeptidase